ncbi:MAG: penicillin-binding protein, partial [Paenibacillaceae bacterium]|nr:penicillin-binding protein [Paenibacillaceae bacterium]
NHLLNGSSGQTAALFAAVMKEALQGVPVKSFPVPGNLQQEEPEDQTEAAAPTGLTAAYNPDSGAVSLQWTGVETADAVYHVYRREASETTFTHIMDSVSTAAEDISVTPGTGYVYYVTAYDPVNAVESEPSNNAQVLIDNVELPSDEEQPGTEPGTPVDPNLPGGGNGNQGTPPGNGQNNGGNGNGNGNNGNGNGNGNGNNGNGHDNGGGGSGNGTELPPMDGDDGGVIVPPVDGGDGTGGADVPAGTTDGTTGVGG